MSSLQNIYAFRQITPTLATAGQPAADQLAALRDAEFDVVINLALPTSDNAIPAEGSLVTALGMVYLHIPVDFAAPADSDLSTFRGAMKLFADKKVFVHCAANMRVSAFVFLHRVLDLRIPVPEASADLHAIWHPHGAWHHFIQRHLAGPSIP